MALGTDPNVSAADARERTEEARKLLRYDQDTSEQRRQAKFKTKLASENAFDKIATKLVAKKRKGGTAPVTLAKIEWILGKVRPDLGHRPIGSITTPEIIAVLSREADADNLETARWMRTVVGEVFR